MRFVRKGASGCWLWTGHINKRWGYGGFFLSRPSKGSREKVNVRAHRFSYSTFKGPIPPGKLVCHTCDVRHCVNPDHLFLGTHLDNSRDMIAKGREPAHLRNYALRRVATSRRGRASKLTNAQALEIIQSPEMGITLAAKFGVSSATITRIRNGERWGHLDRATTQAPK